MLDAILIGAGFGGLHCLYKLRSLGLKVLLLEAASEVGGTWHHNRYPGARCDVESVVYSYSFSPEIDAEWRWSERYAAQPEIQRYLQYVTDKLDLLRDIRLATPVSSARFETDTTVWKIDTKTGDTYTARFCIAATGPVSIPVLPDIPGLCDFQGATYHSVQWPQVEPTFLGQRVGVIGTGSSGTQLIPLIARQAERLYVFLRTPNFVVPARNAPLSDQEFSEWCAKRQDIRAAMWRGEIAGVGDVLMPESLRMSRATPAANYTSEERRDILERRWRAGGAAIQGSFKDVMTDESVNAEVADFIREKIRETVDDTALAKILTPTGYHLGTKRICVGTDYYETYNRANVEIVDLKANPIDRVSARGIELGGRMVELDVLIFATGFDALTGALTNLDLRGKNGQSIRDAWDIGPQTYLGLAVSGFPNLFLIGGPGSPSVFSNVVMTNEFQVDYIAALISHALDKGMTRIEARADSQQTWTDHVNAVVKGSLLSKADSWYVGANVPGKPRVILAYTGGVAGYRKACETARHGGFEGFEFTHR